MELKSGLCGDFFREEGKPAGHQGGACARGVERGDQSAGPRIELHPLAIDRLKLSHGNPREARDAVAYGGLKIELSAHGLLGNGGDFRFDADNVGDLIHAFARNNRRIHVAHQQTCGRTLRLARLSLNGPVDGAIGECGPHLRTHRIFITMYGRFNRRRGKLSGVDKLGPGVADRIKRFVQEPPRARIAEGAVDRLPAAGGGRFGTRVVETRSDERESERSVEVSHGDEGIEPVSGDVLFLAGPTASGKTALALAVAEKLGGEIVNADSMQVYADLRLLSARPTLEQLARVPHHLFGHVDGDTPYSVGHWRDEAVAALNDISARGRTAIVVGGTGLYFRALTDGLADVPAPGEEAEADARALLDTGGIDALRALAEQLDPVGAARVGATDRQRLLRLVAVARGTGTPLSELQARTTPPVLPGAWKGLVLEPDREHLYRRIDARAHHMLDDGAVEEAVTLVARELRADRPVLKALGVATLAAWSAGELTREEALEVLARDTRRYAKRQLTWFRNQTEAWPRVTAADPVAAVRAWRGQAEK